MRDDWHYHFSLHHLYIPKIGRMCFLSLGVKGLRGIKTLSWGYISIFLSFRNALSLAMLESIECDMRQDLDEDLRVVIISANGPVFSSGHDLKELVCPPCTIAWAIWSVHGSPNRSVNQLIDQSINQSINQSISQSTDWSINQSINWSISQSIDRSINQSIDQSINQLIDQSINQSINWSIHQSINQSADLGGSMGLVEPPFLP